MTVFAGSVGSGRGAILGSTPCLARVNIIDIISVSLRVNSCKNPTVLPTSTAALTNISPACLAKVLLMLPTLLAKASFALLISSAFLRFIFSNSSCLLRAFSAKFSSRCNACSRRSAACFSMSRTVSAALTSSPAARRLSISRFVLKSERKRLFSRLIRAFSSSIFRLSSLSRSSKSSNSLAWFLRRSCRLFS